jgi:hypothetical protein
MLDAWWTRWHCDRLFFEFFGFLLSVSFRRGSPYSYIIWGNNRPVGGRNSETPFLLIEMNMNK